MGPLPVLLVSASQPHAPLCLLSHFPHCVAVVVVESHCGHCVVVWSELLKLEVLLT
jgi:hypothetical protein